jgi:hypothetical protein
MARRKTVKWITSIIRVVPISSNIDEKLLEELLCGVRYNEKGCWVRGEDSSIYTRIKGRAAHRISYELFKGVKLKHFGCHHCDVPACINPDHIFDGTAADNMKDAKSKGRVFNIRIKGKAVVDQERILRQDQETYKVRYKYDTL